MMILKQEIVLLELLPLLLAETNCNRYDLKFLFMLTHMLAKAAAVHTRARGRVGGNHRIVKSGKISINVFVLIVLNNWTIRMFNNLPINVLSWFIDLWWCFENEKKAPLITGRSNSNKAVEFKGEEGDERSGEGPCSNRQGGAGCVILIHIVETITHIGGAWLVVQWPICCCSTLLSICSIAENTKKRGLHSNFKVELEDWWVAWNAEEPPRIPIIFRATCFHATDIR